MIWKMIVLVLHISASACFYSIIFLTRKHCQRASISKKPRIHMIWIWMIYSRYAKHKIGISLFISKLPHFNYSNTHLGSMLPQYMALSVTFVWVLHQKKIRSLLSKVGGWDFVCWLFSQILDQPRCYGWWERPSLGWRWPLVEHNLQWKTTFGGECPSVEDDLQWETTFARRQPLVEDDLLWKTTF